MQTVCFSNKKSLDTLFLQNQICISYKSAFHLARYEAGKQVTELFPYKERFAL